METHEQRVEREIEQERRAEEEARIREHAERMNYVADLRRRGVHEDNLGKELEKRFGRR
jgi:hypothetical protein